VVKPQFLQIIPDLKGTNTIAQGEALCGKSVLQPKPCRGEIFKQFEIYVKWMPPFQGSGLKYLPIATGPTPCAKLLCTFRAKMKKYPDYKFIFN
tara:strand:- start:141 stop:422 length:282 start_codon:yes stop_codon:yes gene_type:complete